MADDIEAELEAQLASQREMLEGINDAIDMGGESGAEGHDEFLQMRDELRAAVSELESALLEIKRARILQQLAARADAPSAATSVPARPAPPPPPEAVLMAAAGPLPHSSAAQPAAGSACHFRYMDGRWYAGRIQGPGRQAGTLSVVFQVPTRPFMLDPVDVMEALVRYGGDAAAVASETAPAGTRGCSAPQARLWPQDQQQQQRQSGEGAGPAAGDLAVGRRALALLPGSRLYVPVEVIALDAGRATATVLPLQQSHHQGGGGGSEEVVVPLAVVTRHAHVAQGGRGGDGSDGDEEHGAIGCSSSSDSVSALLRATIAAQDDSGDEDGDMCDDEEDGDEDDSDGDGDEDMDLYGSDDCDGDGSCRRRRGASAGAAEAGGNPGAVAAGEDGGGDLDVFAHARLAAAAGALSDAALLADWEAHGRGVASRLLVRMGYVRGQGLGSQGQGTVQVPEVLLLPERKGLGAVDRDRVRRVGGGGGGGKLQGAVDKRRSRRGGARQKRKRAIVAAREARQEAREAEEGGGLGGGGLFGFINSSLGDDSAAARIRKAQVALLPGGAGGAAGGTTAGAAAIAGAVASGGGGGGGGVARRPADRRGLMNHHDAVAGIQTKLSRLHEMLGRHKDNRGLRNQLEAQIRAVQAELAAAQAAAARASKAIHDKDAQKKWLKF